MHRSIRSWQDKKSAIEMFLTSYVCMFIRVKTMVNIHHDGTNFLQTKATKFDTQFALQIKWGPNNGLLSRMPFMSPLACLPLHGGIGRTAWELPPGDSMVPGRTDKHWVIGVPATISNGIVVPGEFCNDCSSYLKHCLWYKLYCQVRRTINSSRKPGCSKCVAKCNQTKGLN